MVPFHLVLAALFGWLEREQRDVIEFLREENCVLKGQLRGRRMRLNDVEHAEICRLVVRIATEKPRWGYTRIPGCVEKPRASGCPIDGREDPEGSGHSAEP